MSKDDIDDPPKQAISELHIFIVIIINYYAFALVASNMLWQGIIPTNTTQYSHIEHIQEFNISLTSWSAIMFKSESLISYKTVYHFYHRFVTENCLHTRA